MRLFSASYIAFIAITTYAIAVRWYNYHAEKLPEVAEKIGFGRWLAGLLSHLPVPSHLSWQLIALGLLALGATIYTFFCPDLIKENTLSRWAYELKRPYAEYRAASHGCPVARVSCVIFYVTGGGYTLCYLASRGYDAVRYLLMG